MWSTIGAISQVTKLPVTTAVTCPTVRIHPAVIAHAAATSAVLLEGRFALGVGSGEALNEHILGDAWPDADTRLEMLEEAVEVIRLSGFGPKSVRLAARIGEDEAQARRTVHRLWPNEALPGELAQVIPTPAQFEQLSELVTEEMVAEAVPCGPDLDRHVAALQEYADAGVDELFVQQIGPDQDAFFGEWARAVLPRFAARPAVRSA